MSATVGFFSASAGVETFEYGCWWSLFYGEPPIMDVACFEDVLKAIGDGRLDKNTRIWGIFEGEDSA